MTAIVVRPAPVGDRRADYMPFGVRLKVAFEINRLWEEFVTEMHSGPLDDPQLSAKFWKYVLAGG